MMRTRVYLTACAVLLSALVGLSPLHGEPPPAGQSGQAAMFGNTPSRNMVSAEKGLLSPESESPTPTTPSGTSTAA